APPGHLLPVEGRGEGKWGAVPSVVPSFPSPHEAARRERRALTLFPSPHAVGRRCPGALTSFSLRPTQWGEGAPEGRMRGSFLGKHDSSRGDAASSCRAGSASRSPGKGLLPIAYCLLPLRRRREAEIGLTDGRHQIVVFLDAKHPHVCHRPFEPR